MRTRPTETPFHPEVYDPSFESPLYPITQIVGIVSCAFAFLIIGKTTLVIGAIVMLVGGLWYVFYSKKQAEKSGLLMEAVSPEYKPREKEGKYKIVVGVSYPETERELLRYAFAIASNYEDGEIIAVNVMEIPPQLTPEQIVSMGGGSSGLSFCRPDPCNVLFRMKSRVITSSLRNLDSSSLLMSLSSRCP
ncbi:hypothetical protein AKJ39_05160 [candidate division MSBL1 archaeon SCGC-AAA259J03]|uniref:UspA domain-containing protein n=1 Tax=candidate division MSBL1 archaeon SCGC-AAA259J03 TaxID=1698269 RepID=A0A656YUE8_9EURY|nr:hypothetical protein AKJ39_05160 [candidate division MSBL1 archaeon SCGC-AAA259J03]